jgi:hypothetical protein
VWTFVLRQSWDGGKGTQRGGVATVEEGAIRVRRRRQLLGDSEINNERFLFLFFAVALCGVAQDITTRKSLISDATTF